MIASTFENALHRRLARIENLISKISNAEKRLSQLRLLSIVIALVSLGLFLSENVGWMWMPAMIAFAAFLFLIQKHDRVKFRSALANHERTYILRSLEQLQFESPLQTVNDELASIPFPPHATDLNLIGKNSLSQLLDRTTSIGARKKLDHDLVYGVSEISERRQTHQFFAKHYGAGSSILGLSNYFQLKKYDSDELRRWINYPVTFNTNWRWLGLIGVAWSFVGKALGYNPFLGFVLLFMVSLAASRTIRVQYYMLMGFNKALIGMDYISRILNRLPNKPDEIASMLDLSVITESRKYVSFANQANDELMHGVFNTLFWYDAWVLHGIKTFKSKHGEAFAKLLDEAATLESIISQSHALHLPQMIYTEPSQGNAIFEAKELLHPLIKQAVANDVRIENGEVIIITGSNMSGKTTFLRTIGITMQMHQAGLPIRAASVRLKDIPLMTSIRITDDLAEGESFFYAEVRSLKAMIDRAKSEPIVCMIDEMLKGTNTRERLIASKSILKILRESGATVLVSTHDIELSEIPSITNYHFNETANTNFLEFDYKLKRGVIESTNALKILVQQGIPVIVE